MNEENPLTFSISLVTLSVCYNGVLSVSSSTMAPKTIRIVIKEMLENGERYFLAESPDVSGFLAEADTLEEMVETASEVMDDLIDLNNKTADKYRLDWTVLKDYTYQFLYQPAKMKVRHLEYA